MSRDRVTPAQLHALLGLRHESHSKKYGRPIMPFWLAIEIGIRRGIVPPGAVTVARLAAFARKVGLDAREYRKAAPAGASPPLRPLEAYEFDISWCRQVYLTDRRGLAWGRYEDGTLPYNNRELPVDTRIYRFLMVDKASGAFCGYYLPHERLEETAFFFHWALGPKWEPGSAEFLRYNRDGLDGVDEAERARLLAGDPAFPMKGVPRWIRMDRASANQSPVTADIVRRLTGHPPIIVQRPNQQGSVESQHWGWERAVESALRLDPAAGRSFAALNRAAYRQAAWVNAQRDHSRHHMTRFEAFLLEPLIACRIPPPWPTFAKALRWPLKPARVSNQGIVTYETREYRIPDAEYWSEWVAVRRVLFADAEGRLEIAWPAPGKRAAGGLPARTWLVPPIVKDRYGYPIQVRRREAVPLSRVERAVAALPVVTPGPVWPELPSASPHVARRGIAPAPVGVVALGESAAAAPTHVDAIEASRRLARALGGDLPDVVAAERDRRWGAAPSIEVGEVEALIAWAVEHAPARRVGLVRG